MLEAIDQSSFVSTLVPSEMLVAIFSCFVCVNADLSQTALKGIDQLVDSPVLSPILGFVALHCYLPNYRLYGHYGSGDSGTFCGTSKYDIGELLREKIDCPLDWNAEWIQRLFPSQDGSALTYNKLDSDLVHWFTPKIIALLLRRVDRHTPADTWLNLTQDLTNILLSMDEARILNKELSEVQKKIARTKKKMKNKQTHVDSGAHSSDSNKSASLDDQLEELKSKLKSVVSVSSAVKEAKETEFKQVAELFVNAIKESREPIVSSDPPKYHYPPYLPEQALLAFMVVRMDTKEELIPYLVALGDLLKDPSFLTDEGVRSRFAQDVWVDGTEVPSWESILHADLTAQNPSNRESLIQRFMEETVSSAELPPRLMDESVTYEERGQVVRYSDCGETSLRNFFNAMLYDTTTKRLNIDILEALEKQSADLLPDFPRLHVSEEIKQFYTLHTDPRDTSVQLHNEWGAKVVSRKPGVHYASKIPGSNTPGFAVMSEGSQANMFRLLGHLLFDEVGRTTWFNSDAEKQLAILTALFSREGFRLGASLTNNTEGPNSVTVTFTINGQRAFDWIFIPGHIYFQSYAFTSLQRMETISTDIWTLENDHGLLPLTPLLATSLIVPPVAIQSYFLKDPGTAMNFVFSLDFSRIQDTFFLFTVMVGHAPQLIGPFAARIADKLLRTESYESKKQALLETLNGLKFPFGIPPSLGFTKVPVSELPLQPTTPPDSGPWFRTSILGTMVYISDPVDPADVLSVTVDSSELIGDQSHAWLRAYKFCLSLNPPSEIERVRSQLEKREEAIQQLGRASGSYFTRIMLFCDQLMRGRKASTATLEASSCMASADTPQIREIYQRFPIRGFSLLGFEQMTELRDAGIAKWILPDAYGFVWTTRPNTSVSLSNSMRVRSTVDRARCAYSE